MSENKKNLESLKDLAHELLIAPMRCFRDDEKRGYFEKELLKRFEVSNELLDKARKNRCFKIDIRPFEGDEMEFFYLSPRQMIV